MVCSTISALFGGIYKLQTNADDLSAFYPSSLVFWVSNSLSFHLKCDIGHCPEWRGVLTLVETCHRTASFSVCPHDNLFNVKVFEL